MDIRSEEILKRFAESWITTQSGYESLIDSGPEFNLLIPIYTFIRKLKQAGEDQFFRLGISKQYLIICRSVESKLRQDQKYIQVRAMDKSFVATFKDATKMYREYTIKDLDDERLTGLLQTLKGTLID